MPLYIYNYNYYVWHTVCILYVNMYIRVYTYICIIYIHACIHTYVYKYRYICTHMYYVLCTPNVVFRNCQEDPLSHK